MDWNDGKFRSQAGEASAFRVLGLRRLGFYGLVFRSCAKKVDSDPVQVVAAQDFKAEASWLFVHAMVT